MSTMHSNDREMMAAANTAQRNPMRPPDTLPRDAATALGVFWKHPSTLLIVSFVVLFAAARLAVGGWSWVDAAIALALVAYFPINEWLIHVVMLHYRPRKIFGRTIDFYLPVTHRRHHADPWNLKWVFIPRHVHAWTLPAMALILWLGWPVKELVLT
ncbi:MAG: hypothetical protein M3O62_00030, partial [Pseudomonadota bacterium]|nr:hypothetical protein [Pseudomonadota bacterium]